MEIKDLFMVFGAIVGVGLLIIVSIFVITGIGTNSLTISDSSSSSNATYTTPITLTSEEGITSATVQTLANGSYLEFDGDGDRIGFGNNSQFSLAYNNNKTTISVWAKMGNWSLGGGSGGTRAILGKGCTNNFEYRFYAENDTFRGVYFASYNQDASIGATTTLLNKYISDEWYHFVITLNGTSQIGYSNLMYRDRDNIPNLVQTPSNLFFGTRCLEANQYFNGSINQVKIYNDFLKPMQIAEDYKISKLGNGTISIPVLMLHQYGSPETVLKINETRFRMLLNYLNISGYKTITDIDFNNGNIPERAVMLIWDDGDKSVINASLIMDEYGFVGIAAITTSLTEIEPNSMNWTEIEYLISRGWSIASHSDIHCHHGSGTAGTSPSWCNTTETRQGNLSLSKQKIIDNTEYTPITMIFPYNDWGQTTEEKEMVMSDCALNYSLCFGGAKSQTNMLDIRFININTNPYNGDLIRIEINDATSYEDLDFIFNYTIPQPILDTKLNSNNGTIAYDSSGNNNQGTISGATWQNDGAYQTLVNGVDYTLNTATGVLTLGGNYLYSWIEVSWNYTSTTVVLSSGNLIVGYFSTFIPWLGIILLVIAAGIVLFYVISSFKGGGV